MNSAKIPGMFLIFAFCFFGGMVFSELTEDKYPKISKICFYAVNCCMVILVMSLLIFGIFMLFYVPQ